jgi:hypothetical protein
LVGLTSSYSRNGWVVKVPIDPKIESVNPSFRPPQDHDLDGHYEDVNGDGQVNIIDVQALFHYWEIDAIQNNPEAFDYNDDGEVNIVDVQALFNQI